MRWLALGLLAILCVPAATVAGSPLVAGKTSIASIVPAVTADLTLARGAQGAGQADAAGAKPSPDLPTSVVVVMQFGFV